MSATGTEVVTLEQLKMLGDTLGGAGGKKYKIETSGVLRPQVQSIASAGDVVIIAAGDGVTNSLVKELGEEDPSSGKVISEPRATAVTDALPQVVQDALANMPQTMVPTPTAKGYQWFIMPPCDVYIEVY